MGSINSFVQPLNFSTPQTTENPPTENPGQSSSKNQGKSGAPVAETSGPGTAYTSFQPTQGQAPRQNLNTTLGQILGATQGSTTNSNSTIGENHDSHNTSDEDTPQVSNNELSTDQQVTAEQGSKGQGSGTDSGGESERDQDVYMGTAASSLQKGRTSSSISTNFTPSISTFTLKVDKSTTTSSTSSTQSTTSYTDSNGAPKLPPGPNVFAMIAESIELANNLQGITVSGMVASIEGMNNILSQDYSQQITDIQKYVSYKRNSNKSATTAKALGWTANVAMILIGIMMGSPALVIGGIMGCIIMGDPKVTAGLAQSLVNLGASPEVAQIFAALIIIGVASIGALGVDLVVTGALQEASEAAIAATTEATTETTTEAATETATETTTEATAEAATKTAAEDIAENVAEDVIEDGAEDAATNGAEVTAENTATNGAEVAAENTAADGAAASTQVTTKTTTQLAVEAAAEATVEVTTDDATEGAAASTNQILAASGEISAETGAEDTSETTLESTTQTAKKSINWTKTLNALGSAEGRSAFLQGAARGAAKTITNAPANIAASLASIPGSIANGTISLYQLAGSVAAGCGSLGSKSLTEMLADFAAISLEEEASATEIMQAFFKTLTTADPIKLLHITADLTMASIQLASSATSFESTKLQSEAETAQANLKIAQAGTTDLNEQINACSDYITQVLNDMTNSITEAGDVLSQLSSLSSETLGNLSGVAA